MLFSFTVLAQCLPSSDSCEFYSCLENKMKCGKKGYLIKIGKKYCENFLKLDGNLSVDGEIWLDSTRACLQQKLLVNYQNGVECSQLKKITVNDHVDCYIQNGYCSLRVKDQLKVSGLILRGFYLHLLISLGISQRCFQIAVYSLGSSIMTNQWLKLV